MSIPDFIKHIPKVDRLYQRLSVLPQTQTIPRPVMIQTIRKELDILRQDVLHGKKQAEDITEPIIVQSMIKKLIQTMQPNLRPVINATGVIVHTNLGRSILPPEVISHMASVAGHYSNLEYDLDKGKRGQRYSLVESLICSLTGAESATVVNNNAGAVLLALNTIASGKAVIVSRGELVEIGGSFRIPDIMALSGAQLIEVGTTNRTHFHDYQNAITPETGLLLKVHQSNYTITGFSASVSLKEMVTLGKEHQIPVMNDLGSGSLVDFSEIGLKQEPNVQNIVSSGVDIATFSGDKLLGGPQAGIIVGQKKLVTAIRKNPMARALRIDKLTLAALEAILRLYQNPKTVFEKIPTLTYILRQPEDILLCANQFIESMQQAQLKFVDIEIVKTISRIGGGALPEQELPTYCISFVSDHITPDQMDQFFRSYQTPVIGRIEDDRYLLDFRTIGSDESEIIADGIKDLQWAYPKDGN
jgi:L-seryl-tRNA(Ser) seleniumtransferase